MPHRLYICLALLTGWLAGSTQAKAQTVDALARYDSLWPNPHPINDLRFQKAAESLSATPNMAGYDLHHARLVLQLDPRADAHSPFVVGDVVYLFTVKANALTAFVLQLSDSLTVDSAWACGVPVPWVHRGDSLLLPLPRTPQTGQQDSVRIVYHGRPAGASGFGSFRVDSAQSRLWTLSQPYGAMDWLPAKQTLNDKIDSLDVRIRHPADLQALSNGVALDTRTLPNGWAETRWRHRFPIAIYLFAVAMGPYYTPPDEHVSCAGLPTGQHVLQRHHVYVADTARHLPDIQRALSIMPLFCELLGPYPFAPEPYSNTQFGWGGGMEHQTNSFMGNFGFNLYAHELAHQWFGDAVTTGSWQDIWLHEGFATYLAAVASQYLETPDRWDAWRIGTPKVIARPAAGQTVAGGSVTVPAADTASVPRVFNSRLSYLKGGYVLHQLRFLLGDTAFFGGLRAYIADTALRYGYARAPQLRHHLEAASGINLQEYFIQWIDGQGIPSYRITWAQTQPDSLLIVVEQSAEVPDATPFFAMRLPFRYWLSDRPNATGPGLSLPADTAVSLMQPVQSYVLPVGGWVGGLTFDPDRWLLYADATVLRQDAENGSARLILYPNPSRDFVILTRTGTAPAAELALYDTQGRVVVRQTWLQEQRQQTLDIQGLPAGLYIASLTANDTGLSLFTKLIVN